MLTRKRARVGGLDVRLLRPRRARPKVHVSTAHVRARDREVFARADERATAVRAHGDGVAEPAPTQRCPTVLGRSHSEDVYPCLRHAYAGEREPELALSRTFATMNSWPIKRRPNSVKRRRGFNRNVRRALGTTTRFFLSYGVGIPSKALRRTSAC